nr:uncharacterized protein LOC127339153 [Lolium perenne]
MPDAHEMGAQSGRYAYPSRDGSPEVGESVTGPSPSSIDLNRAPANSKGPKHLGAAAMAGARNLLDDLSAERAQPPLQAPSTVQAPPFPQTMPTPMPYPSTQQAPQPPPINTQEDTTACPGSINIEEESLFTQELTQAATAQARARRVSKRTTNYTEKEDKPFESDRSETSLQKRLGAIQTECNKFQAVYDHVKRIPVSGMGVKDLV